MTAATALPSSASTTAPVTTLNAKKRAVWGTKDAYDPNVFYVAGTDDKGHSIWSRQVRMHPGIVEQIETLIQSGDIPAYKSVADFTRDACAHRLAYLRDNVRPGPMKHAMNELLIRIHLENYTDRYEQELVYFTQLTTRIAEVAERALALGDNLTLRLYLETMREEVDTYREPFRTQVLGILDTYAQKAS